MTPQDYMSALLGFVIEATLWGAYADVFFLSILFRKRRLGSVKQPPLAPALTPLSILFAVCTIHLFLGLHEFYSLYSIPRGIGLLVAPKLLVRGSALIPYCNIIGQTVMLHRAWLLWDKTLTAILPAAALTALGYATTFAQHTMPDEQLLPVARDLLLLCSGILTASQIALRRDKSSSQLVTPLPHARRALPSTLAFVIDTGMLSLVAQLVSLVFLAINHPATVAVSAAVVQIYGIAPTLILIHTAYGPAECQTLDDTDDWDESK